MLARARNACNRSADGLEVAKMVMSHRAAALAMRLDVHLEFDIRFPAVERLEVCGWPPRCEPPGSTRSGVMKCRKIIAH